MDLDGTVRQVQGAKNAIWESMDLNDTPRQVHGSTVHFTQFWKHYLVYIGELVQWDSHNLSFSACPKNECIINIEYIRLEMKTTSMPITFLKPILELAHISGKSYKKPS